MERRFLSTLQASVKVGNRRVVLRRSDEIPEGIDAADLARLEAHGSVVSREGLTGQAAAREAHARAGENDNPPEGESFDPVSASEDELVAHIKGNKLNVDDTVALAGEDPELAGRVLRAEHAASGGNPRKGVVEALEAQ